ncbi:hypothetical protein [Neobacillus sp. PS3-40]|uniref:hypothetical protein n=1 Tax=Neobacillus sp. PS3-40 TaxID=3070679 RepID=UPI0027E134FB|nr:hypothetical protein [Neobacillus sp. PS3-40]WML44838.1 hypothetical protein RCG20_02735 [Neobacillus sp. PS3-40]
MSVYNTILHGLASFSVGSALIQFVVILIVTFLVESLVAPIVRKIALSIPFKKTKESNFIVNGFSFEVQNLK